MFKNRYLSLLSLGAMFAPSPAQSPLPSTGPTRATAPDLTLPLAVADRSVRHQPPDDGMSAAMGRTWKATLGQGGFTLYPYFGAAAPASFPLTFRVHSLSVGGTKQPLRAEVAPTRTGDRYTYDRGVLDEIYDLRIDHVAQSFVVDTELAGDVDLVVDVQGELPELADVPGLQFGNRFGHVSYSEAFLVRGGERLPITTGWDGRSLHFRVPAAMRGPGPVVIDPLLFVRATTFDAGLGPLPTDAVDIAYDESTDRYLVVWETAFAANDHDVLCEMFSADGSIVFGSGQALELSTADTRGPRTANVADVDRFVVVFQRRASNQYQGRWMIHACSFAAAGTTTSLPLVLLSDPTLTGIHVTPTIGAHAGDATRPGRCLVAWSHQANTNNTDIHGRLLDGNAAPLQSGDLVLADNTLRLTDPHLARSTGVGMVSQPAFALVYTTTWLSTDRDVTARSIDLDGVSGGMAWIDNSLGDEVNPRISSPIDAGPGNHTWHLVTYERLTDATARCAVFDGSGVLARDTLNQRFLATELHPDADGTRFLVAGRGSLGLRANSMVFDGSTLQFEWATQVSAIGSRPAVVAQRTGLGPVANYGIAFLEPAAGGLRAHLADLRGYLPLPPFWVRQTGCLGAGIAVSGRSFLGDALSFQFLPAGTDLAGFVFGENGLDPLPDCSCGLGVRTDQPYHLVPGTDWTLPIPSHAQLLGMQFSVQGMGLGNHSCLGALRFSHTLDFVIQ